MGRIDSLDRLQRTADEIRTLSMDPNLPIETRREMLAAAQKLEDGLNERALDEFSTISIYI